jgi:hypothetical protein
MPEPHGSDGPGLVAYLRRNDAHVLSAANRQPEGEADLSQGRCKGDAFTAAPSVLRASSPVTTST